MTPYLVHWIAQEIRHRRALLTVEEAFWRTQDKGVSREQAFQRVTFWRRVLKDAEHQLSRVDVGNQGSSQFPPQDVVEAAAVSRPSPLQTRE